ncbi:MAG: methylated-DNA--[protein]-cysteine S-methyltransferase, partial [Bacteroidetes bacterium]|nr:methylated-DNA--[protein]-cysteine S-methyltransferase [Bacteroidota bacterium]
MEQSYDSSEQYSCYYESPFGLIEISITEAGLRSVSFVKEKTKVVSSLPLLQETYKQLDEFFEGKRTKFDLRLDLSGSAFQQKVWKELQNIPYGRTVSYAKLAQRLGDPKLSRAVGAANGRNRIAIIVPCHRVVGSDGTLTGYAGGLPVKKRLLEFESNAKQ